MHGMLQARHTATPPIRLGACLSMGQGSAEDRCRCGTSQEIFSDLISKRDTPSQLRMIAVNGTYF